MAAMDYSPLGKAIDRLREAIAALESEPSNTLYRDATIQRFEFTYGLCASYLARYLEHATSAPLQKDMSFPAVIRTASERGLLRSGWDVWFDFRKARNLTSHVYNEEVACEVVRVIPRFAEEAEYLYGMLMGAGTEDGH